MTHYRVDKIFVLRRIDLIFKVKTVKSVFYVLSSEPVGGFLPNLLGRGKELIGF